MRNLASYSPLFFQVCSSFQGLEYIDFKRGALGASFLDQEMLLNVCKPFNKWRFKW